VYTGSAKRGLDARIERHIRHDKALHWHIDYLLTSPGVRVATPSLLGTLTLYSLPVSRRYHRITSSARSKIDSGMVRPRALAVLRLTTSSNLVGCSIGRSPGLAPFRILST
jgi:hypothetical protein